MTKLLNKAIEKVRKLPPKQQDVIAEVIMGEIAVAARHGRTIAKPGAKARLDELVAEADREIASGETSPLEFQRRR